MAAYDRIFLTDRDGFLRVLRYDSGAVDCAAKVGAGFDRAGPILVGASLVFADISGAVVSVPADSAAACRFAPMRE